MYQDPKHTSPQMSSLDRQLVDAICDEFEHACKSGPHPGLEEYANRLHEPFATEALVELVILDAFYNRIQTSEREREETSIESDTSRLNIPDGTSAPPSPAGNRLWSEYVRRFPQLARAEVPVEFMSPPTDCTLIGDRFCNIKPIASGGLGHVSSADDLQFRRTVAVKEMHERLADQVDFRERFLREAEITGQLEHPGIVPVYVKGHHPNGHPYYVMRLVQGQSLLKAIKQCHDGNHPHGLSNQRRKLLNRFIHVCHAVEYAHSRGVIHRDIKPENIMLGDFGETFLVDWGLAKKLNEVDLPVVGRNSGSVDTGVSGSSQTHMGTVLGTPAYMSPEQSAGDLNKVNKASDIYSLGATLHHILTGDVNVQIEQPVADPHGDSNRVVSRRTSPNAFMAICRQAMESDSARRYDSAARLASDVELALADQPVSVFADPVATRIRRWIQQHLALTAASLVAAGLVVVGAIVFSWMSGNFANELLLKNQVLDQKVVLEKQLRESAQLSEQRTRDAMKYLVNAMRSPDPNRDGRDIKVVDVLEQAVEQLEQDLAHEPLLMAQMLTAFGRTYLGLGNYADAKPLVEEACAIYREMLGENDRLTLNAGDQLAEIMYMLGDPAAGALITSVVERSREQFGEVDADTMAFRRTAAEQLRISGKAKQAAIELESILPEYEANYGVRGEETLAIKNQLAVAYSDAGLASEAVRMSKLVYENRLAMDGPDAPSTISSGSNYAVHLGNTTDRHLARPLHERFLAAARKKWGDRHHRTLAYINRLGTSLIAENDLVRAIPLLKELAETSRDVYGSTHTVALNAANSLAIAYLNGGEFENAAQRFRELYELSNETNGADHKRTLTYANNLGTAYRNIGNYDGAIELFRSTLTVQQGQLGPEHPDSLRTMLNLASTLQMATRYAESISVCRDAWQLAVDHYGADYGNAQTAQSLEAMACLKLQDYEAALTILKASHESRIRTIPEHWLRYNTMSLLGEAHLGLNELDAAEPLLLESYRKLLEQKEKIPARALNRIEQARERLVRLYEAKNMPEEADEYRKQD